MTDRAFHEIADRLAEWRARDEYIEELIAENHQQHTDLGIIARERNELREECAELRAQLASALEKGR
jgi:hypothetical protein